jgi:hypothetical protein
LLTAKATPANSIVISATTPTTVPIFLILGLSSRYRAKKRSGQPPALLRNRRILKHSQEGRIPSWAKYRNVLAKFEVHPVTRSLDVALYALRIPKVMNFRESLLPRTPVNRDKREPKPQTRPALIPHEEG